MKPLTTVAADRVGGLFSSLPSSDVPPSTSSCSGTLITLVNDGTPPTIPPAATIDLYQAIYVEGSTTAVIGGLHYELTAAGLDATPIPPAVILGVTGAALSGVYTFRRRRSHS